MLTSKVAFGTLDDVLDLCNTAIAGLSWGRFVWQTRERCSPELLDELAESGPCDSVREMAKLLKELGSDNRRASSGKAWRLRRLVLTSLEYLSKEMDVSSEGSAIVCQLMCWMARKWKLESRHHEALNVLRQRMRTLHGKWKAVYGARYWLTRGEFERLGFDGENDPAKAERSARCYRRSLKAGLQLSGELAVPGIIRCNRVNLWMIAVYAGDWYAARQWWEALRGGEESGSLLKNLAEMSEFGPAAKRAIRLGGPLSVPQKDDLQCALVAWRYSWERNRIEPRIVP